MSQDALNTPETPVITPAPKPRAARMTTMKLLRNYCPSGEHKVLGHWLPAIIVKDAAGREKEVEPERFVEGESMPPELAGTGFPDKLIAGTMVKLTSDEAKHVKKNRIGEVEVDD